jgi:hypothetical protein
MMKSYGSCIDDLRAKTGARLVEISCVYFESLDGTVGETMTITKAEHDMLTEASAKLAALEAAGVDNWSGYSDAMADFHESSGHTM